MSVEIRKMIEKVESLGWSVSKEGDKQFRFRKYSPAGQDFSIAVEGEHFEEILSSIQEVYEDFDVSEETYIWLDHTGHGKNGAPYHMREVLEDMESCKQMILDLYNELTSD